MLNDPRKLSDAALIRLLREAAAVWLNDRELQLLEELIRRFHFAFELPLT